MMNGRRKSDRPVVATKPANKVGALSNNDAATAEQAERRGLAKGKPLGQNTNRAQDRSVVQSALSRIRQAAVKDKRAKFTSLMHHVYNLSTLREAYFVLKRDAAPGVDGETWRQYGENLESNLTDLSARLRRGAYRAKPVRRVFITKDDGRPRPLGVTALEDKLVQRATVEVLNGIYEADFLGFSYG
jgi:retron-type reverse transcriptase